MTAYDWIIGIGLSFGLAFILNYYTYRSLQSFLVYFTIFTAFMIWVNLLPLWTLIINLIVLISLVYVKIRKRGNVI